MSPSSLETRLSTSRVTRADGSREAIRLATAGEVDRAALIRRPERSARLAGVIRPFQGAVRGAVQRSSTLGPFQQSLCHTTCGGWIWALTSNSVAVIEMGRFCNSKWAF